MMTAVFKGLLVAATTAWVSTLAFAQSAAAPDWTALQRETLEHFQALVRFDTQDPPGREQEAADYLQQVLTREGIPVQVFTLDKPGSAAVETSYNSLRQTRAVQPMMS